MMLMMLMRRRSTCTCEVACVTRRIYSSRRAVRSAFLVSWRCFYERFAPQNPRERLASAAVERVCLLYTTQYTCIRVVSVFAIGYNYNSVRVRMCVSAELNRCRQTRNSAVADKPRDAFVQTQRRGRPPKHAPPNLCYHANLVEIW